MKEFTKKVLIVTIILINITPLHSYAYEYEDTNNKAAVEEKIVQIHDAKDQYDFLAGDKQEMIEPTLVSTNNTFWWPIGSLEVTTINGKIYSKDLPASISISSKFGGYDGFRTGMHKGIDITANGNGIGVVNVIASKSGKVVSPLNKSQTSYGDNGYYGNKDGGGLGNYVKIEHSDGTYTIYGHMAKDSITVFAGETVEQGQVIGKIGSSGSSTGPHLHFGIIDLNGNYVDPLEYVDPEKPRPLSYGSGDSFSLTNTTLSKSEFKAKLEDYYARSKNSGLYNNFILSADQIYDASIKNGINPELVIVTAGTEQNWNLSSACKYTNNYWGIGISNGQGCNSGGKYNSIEEGVAAYANLLSKYNENGSYSSMIKSRYDQRLNAGCDPAGYGLPGTLIGMQSIYSSIGSYRYNPGGSGIGGCYYLKILYNNYPYCTEATAATDNVTHTTTCEQSDYTAWQSKKKMQLRYDIFGL